MRRANIGGRIACGTLIASFVFGISGSAFARHATPAHKTAPHHSAAIAKPAVTLSPFAQEAALSPSQLIDRWKVLIDQASKRVGIPAIWIKAVIIEKKRAA